MGKAVKGILLILTLVWGVVCIATRVDAAKDIVIVIDPGHGGSQNGAEYKERKEKDINIIVSEAMAEELEKYDGVKVYLTHDSAEDEMSIKQRAEFADKVGADYFFCIHFNASENHNFYGSEAWITSYGRYYSQMYAFSEILLKDFEEIGVFNRGIKTKLETDGTDYYGVLRRCAEFDIPAVIIEHAHMDNMKDERFIDEEADLIKFGKTDAVAVAKFLKLKSAKLNVDYSAFEYQLPEEPAEKIQNDVTSPLCDVTVLNVDDMAKRVTFKVEASDDEHKILYYGYSYDGGKNFSELMIWPENKSYIEVTLTYAECVGKQLVVRAYNAYNLFGDSEVIDVTQHIQQVVDANNSVGESTGAKIVVQPQSGGEIYLIIAIISALCAIITMVVLIINLQKSSRK